MPDLRLIRIHKEFSEYKKIDGVLDVARFDYRNSELSVVDFFSIGGCLECGECVDDNYTTDLDVINEGFFSKYMCDLCKDRTTGQRYPAHARDKTDNSLLHYDICHDCYMELS